MNNLFTSKYHRFISAAMTLALAESIALTGCSFNVKDYASRTSGSSLTNVVVQLSWNLNGEFAPITAAILNGYYAEEGLNVTIREGGPQGTSFLDGTMLLSQDDSIDFAIGNDMTTQIQAKDKGDFYVETIGTIWQDIPSGLIVRPDLGVSTLSDLKNHPGFRIGFAGDDWILHALADYVGVPIQFFTQIVTGTDAASFLADQVDGLLGYWTSQAYEVGQAGEEYKFLPLSEIPGYSNPSLPIQTTDKLIHTKPELLSSFLRATAKGVAFTVTHPDAAAGTVLDPRFHATDLSSDEQNWLVNQAVAMRLFNYAPDPEQYLNLNETQLQNYLDFLFQYKVISHSTVVADQTNLQFIHALY